MIQRIQTLWLFIAAAFAALSFKFPFYSGNKIPADPVGNVNELLASSHMLLLLFTAILVAGCLAIIFLYKNRRLQLRLTVVALFIAVINVLLYFTQLKKYTSGNISLTAIFALAIPLLLFLAARGIWKDEKLVKSLDRLR